MTKVIAIELLGSQKHIYVDFKDEELVATFTSEIEVDANATIPLFLNSIKPLDVPSQTVLELSIPTLLLTSTQHLERHTRSKDVSVLLHSLEQWVKQL